MPPFIPEPTRRGATGVSAALVCSVRGCGAVLEDRGPTLVAGEAPSGGPILGGRPEGGVDM